MDQLEPGESRVTVGSGWPALLMAGVAGGVDSVGFVFLGHLFTANMSGNSAALGAFLGQGNWLEALRRFAPIPFFVLGVLGGSLIAEHAAYAKQRPPFSLLFFLELIFVGLFWGLAGFARSPSEGSTSLAVLGIASVPSIAMGVQNATLRRVGGERIRTTFITGMLTNLAADAAGILYRRICGAKAAHDGPAWLWGGIWCLYIFGAVLCVGVSNLIGSNALALPCIGLVCLILIERKHSVGEPAGILSPSE